MANADWDLNTVGKAMFRMVEAGRLEEYIKQPLQEKIMAPLLKGEAIHLPELIDVMAVLIFIHIDLLGYLYTGESSSKNAVRFIRQYFGRIDDRYGQAGGLLYHMLRHGWIHKFTPKRLRISDGRVLEFEYTFNRSREQHLVAVGIRQPRSLLISLPVLYDDLLSAIDLYAADIRQNEALSGVFKAAFQTRRAPEEEKDLRRWGYIEDSDLNFVYGLLT